jgi:hypothetical protein
MLRVYASTIFAKMIKLKVAFALPLWERTMSEFKEEAMSLIFFTSKIDSPISVSQRDQILPTSRLLETNFGKNTTYLPFCDIHRPIIA